jgi:hypothetical protein
MLEGVADFRVARQSQGQKEVVNKTAHPSAEITTLAICSKVGHIVVEERIQAFWAAYFSLLAAAYSLSSQTLISLRNNERFMPCLLSGGLIFLYCLGTAPAHVAHSNALGSLSAR